MFVCLFTLILKYLTTIRISEKESGKFKSAIIEDNVPNIVHYIIFNENRLTFIAYLSILSVLKFHKPKTIFIHTNMDGIVGEYWIKLSNDYSEIIQIKFLLRPTHVYGRMLSSVYHATDVARIHILQKYGGIYLDTDMIVLKSLNQFLGYEMTVGWPENDYFGTQVNYIFKFMKSFPYKLRFITIGFVLDFNLPQGGKVFKILDGKLSKLSTHAMVLQCR